MNLLRLLPRFRAARRALHELEARERWTRAEIDTYSLERLNALWDHAIGHVPYYRDLAAAPRLPARFASLDEFRALVPLLPKDRVRARPQQFLSRGPTAVRGTAAAARPAAP